ncbi:MAG TPA: cyanophycin synthetase [Tepidisphaeraceae bacterium]|jgi:cyanophycin synthetase
MIAQADRFPAGKVWETRGVFIKEMRALREHNLYAYMPVLRVVMDIGPYVDKPSDELAGFTERLTKWLPGLATHECSVGRPGGFIERLKRGTYLPHICEHVCLEIQGLMGFDVSFGRARNAGERSLYQIVLAYEEEEPARQAFEVALRLTMAAMHDDPFDTAAEIERLRDLADDYKLGPSTGAIVRSAKRRGIPIIRLTPQAGLVQLGYGIYQKRIRASETSQTSAIAVDICQEKPLTNRMLRAVGVPVPDGGTADSADEAWEVARDVGLPVVVKPYAGNQGKGVSVNLNSEADVRTAYAVASAFDDKVLVEKYIQGADYRLLVVNGKMVAAARRDPAQVIGDGKSTIEQLVAEVNKDPRRRPGHGTVLTKISLNEATDLVLAQQAMTRTSIPEAGKTVRLRTNANLSTGGTATDVTDVVHPRNAQVAELAAQILNLDVAGIDLLCRDIKRPLTEQNGAIVEVNAAPGLRMHLSPTTGQPRRVGRAIVEMLYPDDAPTRVPIIAVTGTNGKTTVTRLIAHMHKTAKKTVGMTNTDGIYIGDERIMSGDCSGPRSAQAVLLHPHVEVAVLETARGGILREGLGYDGVDVGVVTNVSADHLGQKGIHTIEDLARVKQVVIDAVYREGAAVLNADDPLVASMAADTDAQVIYFSLQKGNAVIASHLDTGGRCVLLENNAIVLRTGEQRMELLELSRVGFTAGGKIAFQVANSLAAVAAAWGAGLNPAIIARALTTFRTDVSLAPGRFNVMNIAGVEVVVDYGHNEAAVLALGQAVQALGKKRTTVVLGLPGDRRDQDLIATASATVSFSDEYVLHDLLDLRGRKPNEVPMLIKNRLPSNIPCEIAPTEEEAIAKAWRKCKPGERILIIADEVDLTLKTIRNLSRSAEEDASCTSPLSPAEIFDREQDDAHDAHTYRTW